MSQEKLTVSKLFVRRAIQARQAQPRHLLVKGWLLEDSAKPSPHPDMIAAEIVEDVEAALQQFAAIPADQKR
jgi:hypothetical protein